MASSTHFDWMRLAMKPTPRAETANRKKKDRLVGEVDHHEQEQQGGHAPCAVERAVLSGHVGVTPMALQASSPLRQAGPAKKRAPTGALFPVDAIPVDG